MASWFDMAQKGRQGNNSQVQLTSYDKNNNDVVQYGQDPEMATVDALTGDHATGAGIQPERMAPSTESYKTHPYLTNSPDAALGSGGTVEEALAAGIKPSELPDNSPQVSAMSAPEASGGWMDMLKGAAPIAGDLGMAYLANERDYGINKAAADKMKSAAELQKYAHWNPLAKGTGDFGESAYAPPRIGGAWASMLEGQAGRDKQAQEKAAQDAWISYLNKEKNYEEQKLAENKKEENAKIAAQAESMATQPSQVVVPGKKIKKAKGAK